MDAQAALAGRLGGAVGGWKLGFLPDGTPVGAPLFGSDLLGAGARWTVPADHGVLIEVEIAFRLAVDLPPHRSYARSDILDSVSEAVAGIEILGSRFTGSVPPLAGLADNLGNRAYVVGSGRADFRGLDLTALVATLTWDGAPVERKAGGHPQGDPLAPLLAYANAQSDRLGGLRAGQVITTGTLTTPYPIDRPGAIEGHLAEIGEARVVFERP